MDGSKSPHSPWLLLALVLVFFVFVDAQIVALLSNTVMSGETAVLSNVVIDFSRDGSWHYPLHAQHLFYPGVSKFIIHPPLHYLLAGLWLKLFGIGTWQIHLQSTLVGIIGILTAALLSWKIFGLRTAIFVPAIAASLFGFYYSSQQLRPDLSFGLMYSLCLVTFALILFQTYSRFHLALRCAALGALAAAALATHWFGYFIQLYLPVALAVLFVRYKSRAVVPAICLALGWCLAMGLWWLAFGDDLFRALVFVLIKGNEFRQILEMPVEGFFRFITDWPGSYWLAAGLVLELIFLCNCLVQYWVVGRAVTLAEKVAFFLVINLAAYIAFFVFFVGNKDPQYGANIYFLLLPLVAKGYVDALEMVPKIIRMPAAVPDILTACFAAAVLVTSSQVRAYFAFDVWSLKDPNLVLRDVQRALHALVPDDQVVLIGGNAFPMLYDRNYRSTMLLVARNSLQAPSQRSLIDMIAYYRNMPGKDYRTRAFPIRERQEQMRDVDMMVTTDMGHSWQWLFYDPEVWRRDFVEIGTVFSNGVKINRNPMFSDQSESFFTVFIRKDRFNSLPARNRELFNASPSIIPVGKWATIVTYGPADRHVRVNGDEWRSMDVDARRSAVGRYFDLLNWYGAQLSDEQKAKVIDELMESIAYLFQRHGYLYNQVPFSRSLSNAIDFAMSKYGIPSILPRQREWAP